MAPEVRVTSASEFITTVEVACINVPALVKSVPVVPVSVIVEFSPVLSSVPADATFKYPVVKL